MKKIISVILLFMLLFSSSCTKNNAKQKNTVENTESGAFEFPDSELGTLIPRINVESGEIYFDDSDSVNVILKGVTQKQFDQYKQICKNDGFTIDVDQDSVEYSAYNSDGYSIYAYYDSEEKELDVLVEDSIESYEIEWPSTKIAQLLPRPESTKGEVSYESTDSFEVYIVNTSFEDYKKYVNKCIDSGFDIDYTKYDDWFYADHADGYSIDVYFEGFNTMYISISVSDEDEDEDYEDEDYEDEDYEDEDYEDDYDENYDETETDDEWREFLAEYEDVVDEYIVIFEKYKENPTDLTILNDYTEIMKEISELSKKAEEFKGDVSEDDMAEYLETLSRISQKLASISL